MIPQITGVDNVIADAISQFQMQHFRLLASDASWLPDPICVFSNPVFSQLRDQCQSLGVAPYICHVYQSGLKYFHIFCPKYRIQLLPAPSMTL